MTRAGIIEAAKETMLLAHKVGMDEMWLNAATRDATRDPNFETDFGHLMSMVSRMQTDETMSIGKLNRWLGWVQAAVFAFAQGAITLEQMKDINLRNRAR